MASRTVEYPSNGDSASGYLSVPSGGPGPGLVVIQEWWGLIDQIKRTADRFAAAGFTALVPDLYHGQVIGLQEPDEAQKAMMALDMGRAARDLRGAVDYLLSSGEASGDKVGTVGFCMGGGLAIALAASHPQVAACVDFYGVPSVDTDLGQIKAELLGNFGDHDDIASPEAVRQLSERLDAAGVKHTFHTYAGCGHAFTNEDRQEVYNPAADELSWVRSVDFLGAQLK